MSDRTRGAFRATARVVGTLCAVTMVASLGALAAAHLGAAGANAPARPIRASELPQRVLEHSSSKTLPHGRWRFAAIGDPEDNRPVFRACLERARALDCAFVVITGDVVKHESPLSYRMLLVDLADFGYRERIATVRGNHDPEWLYRAFFDEEEWTFDIDGIRFVGLDNGTDYIDGEHLAFAKRAFEAPRTGPTFLFIHKPVFPYHMSRANADPRSPLEVDAAHEQENDWKLRDLCVATHVDYVIASHLHAYERETFEGVTQVISGAGGGSPQGSFDGWNLLVVEVDAGHVEVRRENVPDPSFSLASAVQRVGLAIDNDLTQKPVRTVVRVALLLAGIALLFFGRRRP